MKKKSRIYVIHFCHNKECNNGWLDEDLTNAQTIPPKWKYCKECCEALGIDFNKQSPTDTKTDGQKLREENLKKIRSK